MKIAGGPISLARPGWGLGEGSVTSFVSNDEGGHPEVLAAQIICNAALSGVRTLMLLPGTRDEDPVWDKVIALLTPKGASTAKSTAKELVRLPLQMHTCGTGKDRVGKAQLVYAPGLTAREVRRLQERVTAPILLGGTELDEGSTIRSVDTIHVGGDTLVVDSEGFEISVVYDPSGPIYRPA